jgi:hypothetical protein
MEKYLSAASYWLGVVCTVLALISRVFLAFDAHPPGIGFSTGLVSYTSFFHGAGAVLPAGHRQLVPYRKEPQLTLANSRRQLAGRPITPGPSYGLSCISQRSVFSEDN